MRCVSFFFSSRRRHTRCLSDWSSDVCSSDLASLFELVFGELHDEDRVLGREPDQHHETDLGEDVEIVLPQIEAEECRSEERRVGKEGGCRWGEAGEEKKREHRERETAAQRRE